MKRFPWVNVGMAVAAAALLAVLLRPTTCGLPTDVAFDGGALDLGRYGRVVLEAGTDARVSSAQSCELEITLTRGTLGAALHDLKPGRLSVRTPLGAVEVRGTTFSVAVQDQLEVVLLEGAVALRHESTTTTLEPGRALTRAKDGAPTTERVQPAQERRLRELLDPTPIAPVTKVVEPPTMEPAPTEAVKPSARNATELLASAERSRRAGDLKGARELYREAGSAKGTDAEVALLRWARLELEDEPRAALDVLARFRTRYGRKLERARLGAEASFLEVQVLDKLGRRDEARERARELVQRYPNSPHAQAASAW